MAEKLTSAVDWESIERDFRAGVKTLRAIASEHAVSHQAIDKRAKKEGWPRDLSAKIAAERQKQVDRAAVDKPVDKIAEKEVVDANATLQADIILAHRVDIPRKRALVAKLFAEIEAQTDGGDLLEQLTLALRQGDHDKLADMARRVASLPQRIKGVAELITAYKSLIGLERQAFGIDSDAAMGDKVTLTISREDARL